MPSIGPGNPVNGAICWKTSESSSLVNPSLRAMSICMRRRSCWFAAASATSDTVCRILVQVRALVQVAECHLEHVRVCPGRGVFQQILYLLGTGGAELLEFGKAERALVRHFRFFPLGHPSRPGDGRVGTHARHDQCPLVINSMAARNGGHHWPALDANRDRGSATSASNAP